MAADLDPSTEALIQQRVAQFCAPRGDKIISTAWGTTRVKTAGERVLHLPNGQTVKITTDASGQATQVESDHNQHAVVRPAPLSLNLRRS